MIFPTTASPRARLAWKVLGTILFLPAALLYLLGRFGPDAVEALCSPWTVHAYAALLLASCALLLGRARWMAAACAVLVLSASVTVWPVLAPRSQAESSSADPARPSRTFVAFNAFIGTRPSAESMAWLQALEADVLAVSECSSPWEAAIRSVGRWPHCTTHSSDTGAGGIGFFSRHPLSATRCERAPHATFRHIDTRVEFPEGSVRIFAVHPPPPMPAERVASRNQELLWLAEQVQGSSLPTLVLGDFNDTRYGRAFARFVSTTGLRPSSSVAWNQGTWPSRWRGTVVPTWAALGIDHILLPASFEILSHELGPALESDHRAVIAKLRKRN